MVLPDLEEIRKRRQALDLTQQELADGADVLRVVINRIEKRKITKDKQTMYCPSYDDVKRIFNYLGKKERDRAANVSSEKTAGEICNWNGNLDLVEVKFNDTIEDAHELMGDDGQITQLPVFDKGECVGLITQKSMLDNPKAKRVKDAMIDKPVVIPEHMKITPGLIELLDTPQSCILVSKNNSSKIMGIIVAWDLIPKKKENMKHNWKRKGQKRV
tara:strand:+ start:19 stop:666 length:648 start_codon:yes stop_codon:yes gene_type:complete